jgi:hypothetical protein
MNKFQDEINNIKLEDYINKFDTFEKCIVYNFKLGNGGIGDNIKFFMHALNYCIKYNIKLYYLKNNIPIEKYLKLKYNKMYITENELFNLSAPPKYPFLELGNNQEKDTIFKAKYLLYNNCRYILRKFRK